MGRQHSLRRLDPSILLLGTIGTPFHDPLIKSYIRAENRSARARPFTGSDLHLSMQEAACDCAKGYAFAGGSPPIAE
ncbi:mandelate racemase/muconate lactonizing enzyme family protein [Rhodobacterales bacterium Y4I]|nr:mandelate racemase/muconate lactonizing enzyme family protein [Rhodobacterales bacterium Y4I]